MTYSFDPKNANGGIVQGQKKQQVVLQGNGTVDSKHKDFAAALRQSGAETDYLKTASHFGNETFK